MPEILIERRPPATLLSIVLSRRALGAAQAAVLRAIGGAGPGAGPAPCNWAPCANGRLIWLAPDRWMLWGESGDGVAWSIAEVEGRAKRIADACSGVALVTDASHAWACFRIAGPAAAHLLAKGCGLDLRAPAPASPLGGAAWRTLFAEVPVILVRDGPDGHTLFVARSYADWAAGWLADACLEFEPAVSALRPAAQSTGERDGLR